MSKKAKRVKIVKGNKISSKGNRVIEKKALEDKPLTKKDNGKNKDLTLIFIAILLFIIDRLLKFFIKEGVCNNILCLKQTLNYGAVFGILPGATLLFIIAALVLIPILIALCLRTKSNLLRIAFILITTGALSNLIDRIMFGYVIDFVSLLRSSFFNLADIINIMGAIFLVVSLIREK